MCGIIAVFCKDTPKDIDLILKSNESIKSRGPDSTCIINEPDKVCIFNRLAINDLSDKGMQPFVNNDGVILMCNGQIYNHVYLREKYELVCESKSDCEVILRLYEKIGFTETIKLLDGVFAIVLIDGDKMFLARDRVGVRPMYFGYTHEGYFSVASTPQGLTPFCREIQFYQAGRISVYNKTISKLLFLQNLQYSTDLIVSLTFEEKSNKLRELLVDAVHKRLISDRPIACLLSGGLDSSVVTAILCKLIGAENVRTYSIGLTMDSPDIKNANIVAEYLGTKHTNVIVTQEEALTSIPNVIKELATYDITTIRASTMMYLLAKYIKDNTDDIVIFSGEGSDELLGGYLYFHNAPSYKDVEDETMRLVRELHLYDVLRADRCISSNGLEARVPFLDKNVVDYCLSLSGKDRHPKIIMDENDTIVCEKYILRMAFKGWLPEEVLMRKKEAFSDGVSINQNSWFSIIQNLAESKISDEIMNYNFPSKESYYYFLMFKHFYPNYNLIVKYWLPRFCGDIRDPSARVLGVY